MSSIIKKRRGGRTYLYAATSARVGGQPRIVDQVYLGAEDEVIARLTTAPGGDRGLPDTEHHRFGDVAAVWGMLARLDAITVFDSLSVPALLAELDGIGETILLYPGDRGRPRARHTITKMTPTQQRLYEVFDLARYAPHR